MIRRNIDVTLGLVNGTIAKLVSVTRGVDNDVEKLNIILPTGQEHIIERVCVKFEVMDRAFVIRKTISDLPQLWYNYSQNSGTKLAECCRRSR